MYPLTYRDHRVDLVLKMGGQILYLHIDGDRTDMTSATGGWVRDTLPVAEWLKGSQVLWRRSSCRRRSECSQ